MRDIKTYLTGKVIEPQTYKPTLTKEEYDRYNIDIEKTGINL